jgi:phospholipid/cholesterol/gamma-HCH transport system ATP-binding protein
MGTHGTALEIRDLHKSFGEKRVHRGVSFDVRWGEIVGLFGGSGSGKSVILRSVIGLEKPDRGSILYDGRDLTQLGERELYEVRKQIAYVFQNGALFDSLTVEENLAYPLRAHTKLPEQEIRARIDAMLERVDLTAARDLLPAELSGGMQKRAGLARAIILEPRIILFDEPTAGLDPVNTRRLVARILDLKKATQGLTGVFVTHDIPSALEVSDRIAILHEGRIAVIDTVERLRESQDPLVRSFLQGQLGGEE